MKLYYILDNVGTLKYTVNFHDGEQIHNDASPFYDIEVFNNKKKRDKYIKKLKANGYELQQGQLINFNEVDDNELLVRYNNATGKNVMSIDLKVVEYLVRFTGNINNAEELNTKFYYMVDNHPEWSIGFPDRLWRRNWIELLERIGSIHPEQAYHYVHGD